MGCFRCLAILTTSEALSYLTASRNAWLWAIFWPLRIHNKVAVIFFHKNRVFDTAKLLSWWTESLICCIFRPAFGCCAPQKLVKIFIFGKKSWKNEKKQEICCKIHQKYVFWVCTRTLVYCFIPPKMSINTPTCSPRAFIQQCKVLSNLCKMNKFVSN